MPRRIRSADLETRTARLKLPVRKKPFAVQVGAGVHLLYRRNAKAGSWSIKARDGKGGYWSKGFAHADDIEAANGGSILDYWQAIDRARVLARSNAGEGDKPITVAAALDQYEADLRARNGDAGNAARVRGPAPSRTSWSARSRLVICNVSATQCSPRGARATRSTGQAPRSKPR